MSLCSGRRQGKMGVSRRPKRRKRAPLSAALHRASKVRHRSRTPLAHEDSLFVSAHAGQQCFIARTQVAFIAVAARRGGPQMAPEWHFLMTRPNSEIQSPRGTPSTRTILPRPRPTRVTPLPALNLLLLPTSAS